MLFLTRTFLLSAVLPPPPLCWKVLLCRPPPASPSPSHRPRRGPMLRCLPATGVTCVGIETFASDKVRTSRCSSTTTPMSTAGRCWRTPFGLQQSCWCVCVFAVVSVSHPQGVPLDGFPLCVQRKLRPPGPNRDVPAMFPRKGVRAHEPL